MILSGLRPIRLPDRKKPWPYHAAPDHVDGVGLAIDEDESMLIITDSEGNRDIIP